jgi:pyridoxamine---pyruvate transaminase
MTARTSPVFTLTPGPAGATPATLAALGQPIPHHQDPAFRALYAETVGLLRRAFGIADDPVIFPGEAVVGLEAAAASLIAPGDVVLNLVSGVFGQAFGQTARQYASEVIEIEVGYDSAVPPGRVRQMLRARPDVGIVSMVHCETPCGLVNDVGAISAEVAVGEEPLPDAGLSRIAAPKAAPERNRASQHEVVSGSLPKSQGL